MKKFKKIYVEITNICNLSCDFCDKTTREPKQMTINEFLYIATEVKKHSDYIYLHIKGEPLLHKNIDEILKICEKLQLKVCLTTNGTLINKHYNLILTSKAIHKIHISLHSFFANEISLTLDEYTENIANLLKNAEFITVLRFWNNENMQSLNQLMVDKLCEKLQIKIEFLKNNDKHLKIQDKCFIEFGEKFDWPNILSQKRQENGFCFALRNQIGVLVDGTVVPCCLDNNGDLSLGNIFENSIEEIYNFSRSKAIIYGFSNKKRVEDLCKTCGFIDKFNTKI